FTDADRVEPSESIWRPLERRLGPGVGSEMGVTREPYSKTRKATTTLLGNSPVQRFQPGVQQFRQIQLRCSGTVGRSADPDKSANSDILCLFSSEGTAVDVIGFSGCCHRADSRGPDRI